MTMDKEKLHELKRQSFKRCMEILAKAIKEGTLKKVGTAKSYKLRKID